MQTWVWNVTGETTPPAITIDVPTQSAHVLIAGGEQFWVNFTYTELYPANYTVTIGNATTVINSTTNPSVAGGTGTANESFYLNASAADGWYNMTVEMYDNSSNHNISHQNKSVEKGSYDASISQPENQTTEPSVNATYELNITNAGNFTGTFTLAVTNHNGADVAALNETTITDLAIGASQNVTLNVTDASAGTYNVTVNVTSTHFGNEVASTGYIMTTVVGPTLTLGNVTTITSDWGRDFSVNHSVTVTNAATSNVNVTYNVSWILNNDTMGTIAEGGMKWHNQTRSNLTVQKITVKVDATSTTGSATNDSETFDLNITRREIIITADPITPQSADPGMTFWINASANDEHGDTLICKADLIREGVAIETQTISSGNVNFSRTEPLAGTFNFAVRFYNTTHYNNESTSNATMHIVDDTPPASITGLNNLTTEQSRIHWTWTDPTDADFAEVMIYLDGTFKTNVSKGIRNYNATGLDPDTEYTIGTHTVDDKENINQTWKNDTARTLPLSELQRINVTPTAWTLNISESMNFNATGYDHNDDPIDPSNLTFTWYTTPSGIGTLNATTGSVVNFTARHAGRTEIYAVNGSVSSNEPDSADSVWITVNAIPETKDVANGTGNATSGNSTAIVWLNGTSVNGTITIEEIGDPLNGTKDLGNRTGLGADTKSVKGANVTVNGSIEAALNDTGGYVHIRIEYNESQLGNIDENTLYIYKFVNGTGWVKLVAGNPAYCIANGRNTTADYIWVNVTNCSVFLLAGTGAATPSGGGSSGGDGTYPPGWGTPAPTVTATKAPAATTTATATPPGGRVTPAPTKRPAAAKATTPAAEGTTAGAAKNGAPGFTAVFVIAGMLAVAYAMMRRRG